MKIGIFDPYLDTLGGGERYMMTIAECLANQGYEVDVFWKDSKIKTQLQTRLGLDLETVNFVEFPSNLLHKWQTTRQYDLIFYLSDGSIPFLFAKKNVLHFQVPFKGIGARNFLNQLKFKKINEIIYNSTFTKRFIEKEYGVGGKVIYPPVAVEEFRPDQKKNIILAVGRFSQALHSKKQEVLIEAFTELCRQGLSGWQLILVGGLQKEDQLFFDQLKKAAQGLPVKLAANISFEELKKIYAQAKIFWHAAGFGEDEEKYPERMEHFGIVVVEAMAAGCVPVVIGKGGIPEIVNDKIDGFLWQTKEELVKKTLQLIKSPLKMKKVASQAVKASQKFSQKSFCQKINEIIKN